MPDPTRANDAGPQRAGAARERIIAGAMSGTSADGVDVALVAIAGRGLAMTARLLHHHHRPYEPGLRQAIFHVRESGLTGLAKLADLGRQISLTYAGAVRDALSAASMRPEDLACVAAHGQTLYHAPPDTIQWLDPALVAAEVGCAVVSDFRRADCAAGGQGAPLVPFADYVLFRHPTKNRVLLNIGGIANITLLPAGADSSAVLAFDTGPGNCLSDWLLRTREPAGPGYDDGGRRALGRTASRGIVGRVMSDPFFEALPPKATDTPEMIQLFDGAVRQAEMPGRRIPTDDLLAEACCLTAVAIEHAIGLVSNWDRGEFELIATGGGVRNQAIMSWLLELLGPEAVRTGNDIGVPPEAKEAVAFALLAAATLDGVPSNVPSATGARRAVVLGSITPKPF